MKEKSITYQDSTIVYQTEGEGVPVLLIHGFAEDRSVWNNQVEFLKDKCMLIVPDLPGSGQSALVDRAGTGLEDYAELIKQILETEKIEQCIMIGHSMGGYITLAFAEKYPEALTAFALFHSSAYADDAAKVETRMKAIEFIKKNGSEGFLRTSIPGLFYNQHNLDPIHALIEKGKSFTPQALIQYYEAMIARPDRTNVLKETAKPVLFILGEHDKAVPFKQGLEQSHLPHQSYIYVLRNSAHMGMLEETAKANEILGNFLLNHAS